ncbi:VWA-like domain-containing protein [Clostridium neuense]|uniref:VWA-like domain-containing protein n=1 Tax=Clostridium neuense TaxID=1728934 RepID=A0ABW8TKN1_9CLOT
MNNNIEGEIKDLLYESMQLKEGLLENKSFKSRFFKLIEKLNFDMMNGDDNFFGLFLIQLKREIRLDIASACESAAQLSNFVIYFNPYIFLKCSALEMQALIKHEIYHIMYNHIKQYKILSRKYSDTAINTAFDISINQYVNNLPAWSKTIENVKLSYNVDLEYDKLPEYYADKLQKSINKRINSKGKKVNGKNSKGNFNEFDVVYSHDLWKESISKFDYEQIDSLTEKLVRNSAKGKLPRKVEEYIKNLNRKAEISWQDYLKKIAGTLPHGYKKTITRRNRRQPERYDLRGQLSNHIIQIVIAIDISGSMSDGEFDSALLEILSILSKHNYEITVIECDNRIRRVYKLKSKRDLRKRVETKGGTSFSPVFEYMNKNKMKDHFLIYFTDGMGEKELTVKPQTKKILWVLTGQKGDLSLIRKIGLVKKLKNHVEEKFEIYRDVLFNRGDWMSNEWAK